MDFDIFIAVVGLFWMAVWPFSIFAAISTRRRLARIENMLGILDRKNTQDIADA